MRSYIPAIAIPAAVFLLYIFLPGLRENPWTALRITGAILAVTGYFLAILSRVQLGRSFSVRPAARALVTHGLYSRIRNPMYIFVDLMLFGLILALELHWLLVVLAAFPILQSLQAHRESKILEEKFGQAYLDYRKQTWF